MTTMHKGVLLPTASVGPSPATWGEIDGTLADQTDLQAELDGKSDAGHSHSPQTSVSGNAGTATALATGRTIAMTGDVTWTSPAFDGSANVTAAGTIANGVVTTTKMADLAALSVIGNPTNASGVPSAITPANDYDVLQRSGTALVFQPFRIENRTSDPGAPTVGQVWLRTDL